MEATTDEPHKHRRREAEAVEARDAACRAMCLTAGPVNAGRSPAVVSRRRDGGQYRVRAPLPAAKWPTPPARIVRPQAGRSHARASPANTGQRGTGIRRPGRPTGRSAADRSGRSGAVIKSPRWPVGFFGVAKRQPAASRNRSAATYPRGLDLPIRDIPLVSALQGGRYPGPLVAATTKSLLSSSTPLAASAARERSADSELQESQHDDLAEAEAAKM